MTAPPMPIPFPLSWSHYVRLLTVTNNAARDYYEHEALRGGWSVRDLDRQIATKAYQRLRGKPGNSVASSSPAASIPKNTFGIRSSWSSWT